MSASKNPSSKKYGKKRVKRLKTHEPRTNGHQETISKIGNERKFHEDVINLRITGGTKFSVRELEVAYPRALEQWLKLPGSIVKTPTDVLLIHNDLKDTDATSESVVPPQIRKRGEADDDS